MCACRVEKRELYRFERIGSKCMPGKPEREIDYVEINPVAEVLWEIAGLVLAVANLVFWPAVLMR